ncbi:MAG: DUF5110 domain-containing protein, partial [Bacteroidaceae bacterium]|nr:DUF5110 domain-containing protein [Bacteroidaceae bacterium]
TGVCLCHPLYYDYPEDNNAYTYENEYFFGPDILVSPIVTPALEDGLSRRSTWLPEGEWWDVALNRMQTGGQVLKGEYTPDQIPYFYRAGSIIPLYPEQRTVEQTPERIVLHVAPGHEGEGELYEDEGNNEAYKQGVFARTRFKQKRRNGTTELRIEAREGSYPDMPSARSWQVVFLGQTSSPTRVTLGDAIIKSYTYDPSLRRLTLDIPSSPCDTPLVIQIR